MGNSHSSRVKKVRDKENRTPFLLPDSSGKSVSTPTTASMKSSSDQTVLDCPVCFNQCPDGDIACSSCHINKLNPIIPVSCQHKTCARESSYECPFSDECNFSGSRKNLYLHLKKYHSTSVAHTSSDCVLHTFKASKGGELVVFLEKGDDGAIFILNQRRMTISCIQDSDLSKFRRFSYSIYSYHEWGNVEFKPVTHPWPNVNIGEETENVTTDFTPKGLVGVVDSLYGDDGSIEMNIFARWIA